MHTLAENTHIVTVLAPAADRYDSNPATSVVNLALYNEVTFVVAEGAGGTGTAKIEVEAGDDTTPTNTTAIAFQYKIVATLGTMPASWSSAAATGVTPAAGANKVTLVRVRSENLPEGKPYVRIQLTEGVDSPVAAGVIAILSAPRYAQGASPSPLV